MKRIILAATALAVVASPVVVATSAEAAGKNPSCITRAEFNRVHKGMTLTQVKRIVGGTGRISMSAPPLVIRDFHTCTSFHVSNMGFWGGKVQSKLYI